MSLIACTSDCVYQQDGYCGLGRAASCGAPDCPDSCINYVAKCRVAPGEGAVPQSPADL